MALPDGSAPGFPQAASTGNEVSSGDTAAHNVRTLASLFPGVVANGKVDFRALGQLLGQDVAEADEQFGLTWSGKKRARKMGETPPTGTLLACREESDQWDTTGHMIIEGDNLDVLKHLRESHGGTVKVIYIDPPYNTGRDLLYRNDFRERGARRSSATGKAQRKRTCTEDPLCDGRDHSNWLNMMYPRLIAASELLRDDGVLICTIDENELANLLLLLKEVFPEEQYDHVCVTIVHNPRGIQGKNFSYTHEHAIFVYRTGAKLICDRRIADEEVAWAPLRNWGTESLRSDARNCFYPIIIEDEEIVGFGAVCPEDYHPRRTERQGNRHFVYPIDGSGIERKWRYARQSIEQVSHLLRPKRLKDGYDILLGKNFALQKTVWSDPRYDANVNGTQLVANLLQGSPFTFPKSLWAVYDCIEAVTRNDKEAIIMDFFAGSGTTGHATLLLNAADGGKRRYVLVQLPEPIASEKFRTIADITKERMRRASEKLRSEHPEPSFDTGFRVYKLFASAGQEGAGGPVSEGQPQL